MSRLVLNFICVLGLASSAFAKDIPIPPQKTLKVTLEQIAPLAQNKQWDEIIKIVSPNETNDLYRLMKFYALFQLERWSELLAEPELRHTRFRDYGHYLQALAAHQQKNLKRLTEIRVGRDLPKSLRRDVELLQARALKELGDLPASRKAFQDYLQDDESNVEAQLELASIEWELNEKDRAIELYERLYTRHPVRDRQNIAGRRLKEVGRFSSLETSQHLMRVDRLKRAALFEKALAELQEIRKVAGESEKDRIELLRAALEFARKGYSESEKMARKALREINADHPLHSDWTGLLAFSLTRQGQFEEATKIYDELLKQAINPADAQQILLRLGLMDVDDQNFESARARFQKLREDFPRGRFQESAHWFEAWSRYQHQLGKVRKSESFEKQELESAVKLLSQIPKLAEGFWLTPQSIYWKKKIFQKLDEERAVSYRRELLTNWKASFYALLVDSQKFQFLDYKPLYLEIERLDLNRAGFRVPDKAFQSDSWQRLEAFARVHLYDWAKLEMNIFLQNVRLNNDGLKKAIAYRLKDLGDWGDLVRFATNQFGSPLKNLEVGDEVAYFHYPQAYYEQVLRGAKENEISPFLIWGVMREESRFQADVISGAGAVGLMQLMPNLGARIAQRKSEPQVGRHELTDPELNIRYGSFHLRELLDQVKGLKNDPAWHYVLAVASYNAGINPVKRWLREYPTENLDEWVENIPFSETRGYVKRVLRSAHVYYHLYGEPIATLAKTKEDKGL